LIKLVEEYGIDELLEILNYFTHNTKRSSAMTLSTAHKSKGLEWSKVALANDFKVPDEDGMPDEEAYLLYVAITRAKTVLDVTDCEAVQTIMDMTKMYDRAVKKVLKKEDRIVSGLIN
jgi:superfamily I DNA/RNA helicase